MENTIINSQDRIRLHTIQGINEKIDRETMDNVLAFKKLPKDKRVEISRRIEELNQEWDVDRVVMTNFAVVGGTTILRSLWKKKALGALAIQMSFLLYYAVKGWCPPLPIFRKLGFRTKSEIEREKNELVKILEAPL